MGPVMSFFRPFKSVKKPTPGPVAAASPPAKNTAPAGPTVGELAGKMCDRKGVHWAAESAKMSGLAMDPKEQAAMNATQAWLKNPTAATKKAAGDAALKSGHAGPAGWAAQAAAWSAPAGAKGGATPVTVGLKSVKSAGVGGAKSMAAPGGTGTVPGLAKLSGGGSLASMAVAGSVKLSAAIKAGATIPKPGAMAASGKAKMPALPEMPDEAKLAEAHKPFVELGQKIADDPSVKC